MIQISVNSNKSICEDIKHCSNQKIKFNLHKGPIYRYN